MGRRREKSELRDVPGRPKWFQCITPPAGWKDKVAVQAGAAEDGLRTVFLNEFLKQGYPRHQPSKLWTRQQGNNEPGVEYCYEVMNPCRLVDPQMAEAKKLKYLFNEGHLSNGEGVGDATKDVRGISYRSETTIPRQQK
jgi:hypothetical protein